MLHRFANVTAHSQQRARTYGSLVKDPPIFGHANTKLSPDSLIGPVFNNAISRNLKVVARLCVAPQHMASESSRMQRIDRVSARRRSLGDNGEPFEFIFAHEFPQRPIRDR